MDLYFIKLSFTNNWYASKFDEVILPEDQSFFNNDITAKPLKLLMLLHGLSSDETTYMRYTRSVAHENGLLAFMREVTVWRPINTQI